jgi:SOS regulatory protein LexA
MELDTVQKKVIRSKPFGFSILKGGKGSGKTTTAIYRILHLKNNYCLYDEDGILMVNCKADELAFINSFYKKVEGESNLDFISLFSNNKKNVHINNSSDIISNFFKEYLTTVDSNIEVIYDKNKKISILKQCIKSLIEAGDFHRILREDYIDFLLDEIKWIKACCYTELEEYQNSDRVGRRYKKGLGPQRLLKNSQERAVIFKLMTKYSESLKMMNMLDYEDMLILTLNFIKNNSVKKFTHVVIDGSQNLTRIELEIFRALCHSKAYSSMLLTVDTNSVENSFAWLVKGRRSNSFGFNIVGKSYVLKQSYSTQENSKNKENLFVENYQYIDIRHNRKIDFIKDGANSAEVIVKYGDNDEIYSLDELKDLPVYSDIAAGEPILMNTELEANFSIPKQWIKGLRNCFMLKVKGDSMLGANIEDGDYVVIKKQHDAQNHEIVAVDFDGSATLKRLSLKNGTAQLIPENAKYSPINLYGIEASILGIAVGIIKIKS